MTEFDRRVAAMAFGPVAGKERVKQPSNAAGKPVDGHDGLEPPSKQIPQVF